jgi:precorrin-6Y C5,15-methyltransferase (decarboxylating)
MTGESAGAPLNVVGLIGEAFGTPARDAIAGAAVLVGSRRQLALIPEDPAQERIELRGPLPELLDTIAVRADAGHAVCVLASGDPGFFGIVGTLSERFGGERLVVHPAPSSVSLAFALVGLPWDDAMVVSAHGRPLDAAVARSMGPKTAVLTSPDSPPEALGRTLRQQGCGPRRVIVASNLGTPDAALFHTDLDGLATGTYDPMSVVLLLDETPEEHRAPLSWGLPESHFEHRNGMITKAEIRAVALGKLALPPTGVLWDLGAGSGSIAIESARLRPRLHVIAVEQNPDDAARIGANAAAHGARVDVICGQAPTVLADLPDPDRVFVGGGGIDVLDAALARLRPHGTVVASYAIMDRAAQANQRLGNLVQISLARGMAVADLGVRLSSENPVFLCWGPDEEDPSPAG